MRTAELNANVEFNRFLLHGKLSDFVFLKGTPQLLGKFDCYGPQSFCIVINQVRLCSKADKTFVAVLLTQLTGNCKKMCSDTTKFSLGTDIEGGSLHKINLREFQVGIVCQCDKPLEFRRTFKG